MAQDTIKNTKSLSPLTCKEVDAQIIHENGAVYLIKQDEEGNSYKSLIEKDCQFYKMMSKEEITSQVLPAVIFLYISSRCNLNCPVCYEIEDDIKEPSLEEIVGLVKNFSFKVICIIGREPTCREDLGQIIKLIKKRNRVSLATNGIKFSNYEYALRLKRCGLENIHFSFNGFDDQIYKKMSGRPLLDLKLRALENMKKAGNKVILSVTLARGINEDQIKKLCDFCFRNRSFILELRIRSIALLGQYPDIEPYCMSELLNLVAKELDIKKEDILKDYIFWMEFLREFKFILPRHPRSYYRRRLCSFFLYLKNGGKPYSPGSEIDVEKIKKSKFKKFILIYYLIKVYGLRCFVEKFFLDFIKLPPNKNILRITLKSWPSIYNIDLQEDEKCTSQYYKDGKWSTFCYCNIVENTKAS